MYEPSQNLEEPAKNLVSYAWELKKNGRTDETITTIIHRLALLGKRTTNINDPEQVKEALSKLQWKNSTKQQAVIAYTGYLNFLGKMWNRPKYTPEQRNPFIPTEEEIDTLIAASNPKLAALLQLLKETGMRIGEACKLEWTDVDFQRRTVNITPEKNSNPRTLPLTDKALTMLGAISHINEKVFTQSKHSLRVTFEDMRNRTALKLANPRLKAIHFHTFRHWKATMSQHKYHDAWTVKTILGHKTIKSTEAYIHLEKQIWLSNDDEWTHATAKTVEEFCKLIDTGFEYVTEMDGLKILRKRK